MNQISSMTGSGHAQFSFNDFEICVDLRSVNNRFFEFSLRSDDPKIQVLALSLREIASKELFRGKAECNISVTYKVQNNFNVDQNRLYALKNTLTRIEDFFGKDLLRTPSSLDVLNFPGILSTAQDVNSDINACINKTFVEALKNLKKSRLQEGEKLKKALEERLVQIENGLNCIEKMLPKLTELEMIRLKKHLQNFKLDEQLDEQRLEQEVVLMAERDDIQEEYDRLRAHIAQTRSVLEKGGLCGKRLDFMMQEFNREANTMASKTSSLELTHLAVDFKVLIEQMREQVQNIE